MKNIIWILMLGAIFFALYEQLKPAPSIVVQVICIAIFMLGLMKKMSEIPSKKNKDDNSYL